MGTAIMHRVPDQVKPSFVIFDIWALRRSARMSNDGRTYMAQWQQSCCHQRCLCAWNGAWSVGEWAESTSRKTKWMSSVNYGGAWLDKAEKTEHVSLKPIGLWTGSQCNWRRTGEICSPCLVLVVLFCTDWTFRKRLWDMLLSSLWWHLAVVTTAVHVCITNVLDC